MMSVTSVSIRLERTLGAGSVELEDFATIAVRATSVGEGSISGM